MPEINDTVGPGLIAKGRATYDECKSFEMRLLSEVEYTG